MDKIDISVCIPTYKRPQMLAQAIASFLAQDYKKSELLIINDAPDDNKTDKLVQKYQKKDKRIRYIKNKKNLGYAKNFLKLLTSAQGKYIFILGDDDLIIGENTLKKYCDVFRTNKNVDFVYSNIIQFGTNLKTNYVYDFFPNNTKFTYGKRAIEHIWLKSTFIAGFALRNSKKLPDLYPKEPTLFPQVELVGKILLTKDGYGLANYSVGARSHEDQLGFHMMKNQRMVGKEQHAYIELSDITDEILRFAKEKHISVQKTVIRQTVDNLLKSADSNLLLVEGTKVDKKTLFANTYNIIRKDPRVRNSPVFWLKFFVAMIMPRRVLIALKELYRKYLLQTMWKEQSKLFYNEKEHILQIVYA